MHCSLVCEYEGVKRMFRLEETQKDIRLLLNTLASTFPPECGFAVKWSCLVCYIYCLQSFLFFSYTYVL